MQSIMTIKNGYEVKVNPAMASVREAEVEALRARVRELEQALETARGETFEVRELAQRLESLLYFLAKSVREGEEERARRYADQAWEMLNKKR